MFKLQAERFVPHVFLKGLPGRIGLRAVYVVLNVVEVQLSLGSTPLAPSPVKGSGCGEVHITPGSQP